MTERIYWGNAHVLRLFLQVAVPPASIGGAETYEPLEDAAPSVRFVDSTGTAIPLPSGVWPLTMSAIDGVPGGYESVVPPLAAVEGVVRGAILISAASGAVTIKTPARFSEREE